MIEAFEILSNPTERVVYDVTLSTGSRYSASVPIPGVARFPNRGFVGMPRGFQPRQTILDDDGVLYFYFQILPGQYIKVPLCYPPPAPAGSNKPANGQEDEEAKAEKSAAAKAQRDLKEKAKQMKKAAKEAREAAKAIEKEAVEKRLEADGEKQKALWSQENATTIEQKQTTCLHAIHWTKMKQNQKQKCEACLHKRGIFSFKCPYCEILVCQLCQTQLVEEKKKQMD